MQSVADNVKDILTNYGICEPIVEIIQDTMRLETYVRVSGFVEGKEYHSMSKAFGNPQTPEELLAAILAHPLQCVYDNENPTS